MLKLGRVTKVKVLFLVLVFVFNFDLFKFSAAILEKGLFRGPGMLDCKMFSLGRQFAGANGLTDSAGNFFVLHMCRVLINLMVKTIIGQLFVCLL